jgi:bifunctional non-homologous end joining protein LigD
VSVPVAWDELDELRSGAHWTVHTLEERLAVGNAPWHDYADRSASLEAALQQIGLGPDDA